MRRSIRKGLVTPVAWVACALASASLGSAADEPPALNPFGTNPNATVQREDSYPGYVEFSSGAIYYGRIYTTRDKRLMVNDTSGTMAREREIPLRAVKQIDCRVVREWIEKEWRFKEMANDEKVYTGRSYPSRMYQHKITLTSGKTIEGDVSGVFYLLPGDEGAAKAGSYVHEVEPVRFSIHKRDKGKMGDQLKDLLWVKTIKLGEEAFKEGKAKYQKRKDAEQGAAKKKSSR